MQHLRFPSLVIGPVTKKNCGFLTFLVGDSGPDRDNSRGGRQWHWLQQSRVTRSPKYVDVGGLKFPQ